MDQPHQLMIMSDLQSLHPLVKPQFLRLNRRLEAAYADRKLSVPLHPFEAFRTPIRQARLYRQGRSEPGRIVTNADAWQSPHNFGLAVDFVPKRKKDPTVMSSAWVWDWDAATEADWALLSSLASSEGLSSNITWDKPHVEAADVWDDFKTIIKYRSGEIPFVGIER